MLEAVGLTKRYSAIPAVQDVSFQIRRGQILGYLGPNGSGKSTTVKMLTGLLEPTAGQILFDGVRIYSGNPFFARNLGYVPEEPHIYSHLTGAEYLRLVGRLHSIPRHTLERKIDAFIDLFSLRDARYELLRNYSKGMRQKILLSAALLHNPEVLILDEPFSGLDVGAALVLRNLLKALAREGKIILYSSHVLEVVEKVCSEVVILYKGKVVAYDTVERLRELQASTSLESVFAQLAVPEDTSAIAERIVAVMKAA
ncbi:MAG: ABC transporter ATP-binding protein [Terriglobales bacterium]|jgi:ABC-2 type transport system ATP-binding protein